MKTKTLFAEPLLNGKLLKNCKYSELKAYALEIGVNIKSLPKLNENNLIKGIKIKLSEKESSEIPFYNLPANLSRTFVINYAFHFKVPKEEIIERLGIKPKTYVDVTWLYDNANYKKKIEDYLANQQAVK